MAPRPRRSARHVVVFVKNTTAAINKLAFRYPLKTRSVVLPTVMEHHSNDLPWRGRATVVRAKTTGDGRLDEEDVDRLIDEYEQVPETGNYRPVGYEDPMPGYFSLKALTTPHRGAIRRRGKS